MADNGTAGGRAKRGIRAFEFESLVDEIQAQPAPPCDEFKCARRHTCAVNEWACKAFAEYVASREGTVRKPDFSDPAERPDARIFSGRLAMRPLPRPQEKTEA
jgi:hypothetical protein